MKDFTKIYKFYDTDPMGVEEYNIEGQEYINLIEVCCRYCKTLSLIVTNNNSELLHKLKKFETHKSPKISFGFPHYENTSIIIKYYNVCPELCDIITSNTSDIFCWINGWGFKNPEDPTFYREDGSVFFTSTIHEGECTLIVNDEDVSTILYNNHWVSKLS